MLTGTAIAAAPGNYYSKCENLSGKSLLEALFNTMSSHTNVGYDGLWDVYETSDIYPSDGKVWDMYSTKHWTVNQNQCGNYSVVGDCYNREHSFPKSWFSKGSPMVSDAYHIYPTDGKVNGQRSNFPYGECANGTTLPSHDGIRALGKLGSCTFAGYTGTVFEPDDQYKGDFARSYFYMAAAYYDKIKGWSSEMLNGTQYPAFSTWALNLLLKWHRQDPVSSKEISRNDAVYAYQHNRNPFIDHPEMVEYIWGDKQSEKWTSNVQATPTIILPANGSTLNMGHVAVNHPKSAHFTLKGEALKETANIAVTGEGYTVTPATITAADANKADGADITVTLSPTKIGDGAGTITITCGSLTCTVHLTASIVEGLHAADATNVSDRSFTAHWTFIGDEIDGDKYTLYVVDLSNNQQESMNVTAAKEEYDVEGLSPLSDYEYWIESASEKSNVVKVTTHAAIPSVQLYYDGVLELEATSGEPSQAYEVLIDAENITDDITIEVETPFQLSTDKSAWGTKITLSPDEERFYMRLYGDTPGAYETEITITAGEYVNNDICIEGYILGEVPFVEDFEADLAGCSTYDGCTYAGTATSWYLADAGLWEADSKYAHSGHQALRMGKSANSCAQMAEDKHNGIGKVSLWACQWSSSDGDASFIIEYSTDGGITWLEGSAPAEVTSTAYAQYDFDVNVTGNARIRIAQTSGKRFIIDDISITNYTVNAIEGVESDYHSWDAYCRDGKLLIQSRCAQQARVYGVDGITYFNGAITAGTSEWVLPAGLYVVAVSDFTRVVLVK